MNKNKTIYKDSPLGKIPNDWEVRELGSFSNITSSKRIMMDEYVTSGIPFYRSKEIIEKINGKVVQSEIHIPEDKYLEIKDKFGTPEAGQVLITAVGSLGQTYLIKESDLPFYFKDGNLIWLKNITKENLNIDYLISYFKSPIFKRNIDETTYGSSQKALTIENLNYFKIPFPPLPEQKAIAHILGLMDTAININNQLIAKKELQKKWLMQNLLSGKKRLKGFEKEKWVEANISDLFERVIRKNSEQNTNVVTISAQRGFVRQTDFFNKSIASEIIDNYFLVKKGEFCYNKSYSNGYPWGAIKRLKDFEKAVVTTLYICFGLRNSQKGSGDFFEQYFEANLLDKGLTKIAHEGGRAHGLLNVTPSDFFSLKIIIPAPEEQTAIAQVLQAADKEIQLLKTKTEKLKEQKKGLMQVLLTGKKRINVHNSQKVG